MSHQRHNDWASAKRRCGDESNCRLQRRQCCNAASGKNHLSAGFASRIIALGNFRSTFTGTFVSSLPMFPAWSTASTLMCNLYGTPSGIFQTYLPSLGMPGAIGFHSPGDTPSLHSAYEIVIG